MLNDFHEGTAGEGTEQPPKAHPTLTCPAILRCLWRPLLLGAPPHCPGLSNPPRHPLPALLVRIFPSQNHGH